MKAHSVYAFGLSAVLLASVLSAAPAHAAQVAATARVGGINGIPGAPNLLVQNSSSTSTSIAAQTSYQNFHPNSNNGALTLVSGSARSYSDLATGKLGFETVATSGVVAQASALWSDRITLFIPGATAATTTALTLRMTVHGETTRSGSASNGIGFVFSAPGGVFTAQSLS